MGIENDEVFVILDGGVFGFLLYGELLGGLGERVGVFGVGGVVWKFGWSGFECFV